MFERIWVNEIFHSLQGEGARMGQASIFIRLAGCNLSCHFCDTEFDYGTYLSVEEILEECGKYDCEWIVWSGGEPMLQLNESIMKSFRGYKNAIETNGTRSIDFDMDWVCVSPKIGNTVLSNNFKHVNELKYVLSAGMPLPNPHVTADHYFLSPMFTGDTAVPENISHCTQLCLNNPKWKLTLQNHKIWGIK